MDQYTLRADGDDIVVTQVIRLDRDTAARRLTRVCGRRPRDRVMTQLTGSDSTITAGMVADDLSHPTVGWDLYYTDAELAQAHAILDRVCPRIPTWDEMSDVDKGAALLHMAKLDSEGDDYAIEEYPCRYLENPALVALSPTEACAHAVAHYAGYEEAGEALGWDEVARLYDLALEAESHLIARPDGGEQ